jgi:hypothetical protein
VVASNWGFDGQYVGLRRPGLWGRHATLACLWTDDPARAVERVVFAGPASLDLVRDDGDSLHVQFDPQTLRPERIIDECGYG